MLSCRVLGMVRAQLSIINFVTECEAKDVYSGDCEKALRFAAESILLSSKDYFQRVLKKLQDKWLSLFHSFILYPLVLH